MSRGASVIINGTHVNGRFFEGIVNAAETPMPGTIMQIDPTQALQGGRHVVKAYNRDADGNNPAGPHLVLLENALMGKTIADAYAAGERCFLYAPLPGDELNLYYKNETGTGDDVAAGALFIVDDGTGKVTLTTGSPEQEVAMALEAAVDPTADTHIWSIWS